MMQKEQLDGIRQRLVADRESLLADIDDTRVDNQNQQDDYGAGNHMADDATEVFLRERNIALNNNASDILAQVDAAIERIDNGTYGTCTRCGRAINPERLEALPYAPYCISCQSEIERGG